eukprot:CAMPEP_0174345092 /NCGR_PEP_ID=MMETSP0811_2-20130205/499_1 /TAXON_ID=73025 ORGANISM="Eutreptiella gymnastica-like, Strain CCMP1594" /NCGR_SAMPLE_ID=MMETSP0811_2 /ASSEMBLY_ACC=CAM_ASM_000667 /LENGTH=82 /DNA_ID=CAMNT_0015468559 /DNA_START=559 /DNA_END=806 /DNA_ORIENTATION=-
MRNASARGVFFEPSNGNATTILDATPINAAGPPQTPKIQAASAGGTAGLAGYREGGELGGGTATLPPWQRSLRTTNMREDPP